MYRIRAIYLRWFLSVLNLQFTLHYGNTGFSTQLVFRLHLKYVIYVYIYIYIVQ